MVDEINLADADFSGYATKAGLKCTDGRTIQPNAFQPQDGKKVPLVWHHGHSDVKNVLGHAILKNVEDGVYAYGFFNGTDGGQAAKQMVEHGDITMMSIFANQLVERAKTVLHGAIREVSLVLSGANPGALIENVRIAHSDDPDDVELLEEEAIIFTGLALEHSESNPEPEPEPEPVVEAEPEEGVEEGEEEEVVQHADDTTVKDVYDGFSDVEKDVVHYMIGAALEASDNSAEHSDTSNTNEGDLTHQEGTDMTQTRNVFEQDGLKESGPTLSHAQIKTILDDVENYGGSVAKSFMAHAAEYGIEDIDLLFPDAKNVTSQPDLISRRTEWVAGVIDGAKHSPFARIKSMAFDVTADEARAKGYVKGNLKKEEVIKLLKRVTTPTTVYKKQKLDRDDVVDITDLDVIAYLKWEMRFMLEEELARAILIGDGREPDDEDKIDEEKLRPIAWDNEMYAHPVTVPTNVTPDGIVESILRARKHYKGTGRPSFYTTDDILTDMILIKDKMGRRLYNTEAELAAALRVDKIVVVEVMENTPDLLGIIVNISDYTIGADKGGQLSMFDDFDIDFNQLKYLLETRVSGTLTKPKSAVVIKRTSGTTVTPTAPTFNPTTNTITFPSVTGVVYKVDGVTKTGTLVITETTDVEAEAASGYNFPHNTDADWTFAFTE